MVSRLCGRGAVAGEMVCTRCGYKRIEPGSCVRRQALDNRGSNEHADRPTRHVIGRLSGYRHPPAAKSWARVGWPVCRRRSTCKYCLRTPASPLSPYTRACEASSDISESRVRVEVFKCGRFENDPVTGPVGERPTALLALHFKRRNPRHKPLVNPWPGDDLDQRNTIVSNGSAHRNTQRRP